MTRYLPDPDVLVLQVIRAALGAVDSGTEIPRDLVENLPFIVVNAFGGKNIHPKLAGSPRVDVQCWSDSRKAAADLAESVRIAIWESVGQVYSAGHISFQECTSEPAEVPNATPDAIPAQNLYRFQATYRLVVRSN